MADDKARNDAMGRALFGSPDVDALGSIVHAARRVRGGRHWLQDALDQFDSPPPEQVVIPDNAREVFGFGVLDSETILDTQGTSTMEFLIDGKWTDILNPDPISSGYAWNAEGAPT